VLQKIWGYQDGMPMPPELLVALAFTDCYVAGVFDDGRLVGASAAFRSGPAGLHSQIAGLIPEYQGRSAGYALKLHQRAWALERGITSISWTFDPLVRRNAHFNLVKLGAAGTRYLPDFYGPMVDAINVGDHSDRMLVEWNLTTPADPTSGRCADATAVLAVGADGEPVTAALLPGTRLAAIPRDIEAVRRHDRPLANRWRQALRSAMLASMADGYGVAGLDAAGAYVLQPAAGPAEQK
jgi:predicted GNAT superfamily acetyltransferase